MTVRFFVVLVALFLSFSASAAEYTVSPTPTAANLFLQPAEGIRRVSGKLSLNFEGRELSSLSAAQRASRWVKVKEKKAAAAKAAAAAEAAAIEQEVDEAMLIETCEIEQEGKAFFCKKYRLDDDARSPISGSYEQFYCPYADFDPKVDFYTCRGMAIDGLNAILDLYQAESPIARLKYQVFRTQTEIFLGKSLEGEYEVLRLKLLEGLIRAGDLINGTNDWELQEQFRRVAQQQVLGGETEN